MNFARMVFRRKQLQSSPIKQTGSVASHLSVLQQILPALEGFACNLPSVSLTSFSRMMDSLLKNCQFTREDCSKWLTVDWEQQILSRSSDLPLYWCRLVEPSSFAQWSQRSFDTSEWHSFLGVQGWWCLDKKYCCVIRAQANGVKKKIVGTSLLWIQVRFHSEYRSEVTCNCAQLLSILFV